MTSTAKHFSSQRFRLRDGTIDPVALQAAIGALQSEFSSDMASVSAAASGGSAALQVAVDALQSQFVIDLAAASVAIGSLVVAPPPPPPPSTTTTPDGAVVAASSTATLTDKNGDVWSFGALWPPELSVAPGPDYDTLKNGAEYAGGGGQTMTIFAGVVYVLNSAKQWFENDGNGWSLMPYYAGVQCPPGPFVIPPHVDPSSVAIPAVVRAGMGGDPVQAFLCDFDDETCVDVANKKPSALASAVQWFVERFFNSCTWANPAPPWGFTPQSMYSVANSWLTLFGDGYKNDQLCSVCDDNVPFADRPAGTIVSDASGPFYSVDPMAFKGYAFSEDVYVERCTAVDPRTIVDPTNQSFPAEWTMPLHILCGADAPAALNPLGRYYVELDGSEWMIWISTDTFALNDNYLPRPPGSETGNLSGNCRANFPPFDYTRAQITGWWHGKARNNGGTGFVRRFVNGVEVTSAAIYYQCTATSPANAQAGNPPGSAFSNLENQIHALILGAGTKSPFYVDWERAWVRSMSDMIVK